VDLTVSQPWLVFYKNSGAGDFVYTAHKRNHPAGVFILFIFMKTSVGKAAKCLKL